ncbi:hypothetical protein GGR56DRAFT_259473 [Xylariaceae sp. FL0804]|nr:hypothetical protein GGR56DRAFT_259473 [Xylariaceae sp. FL0804]
MAVQQYRCRPTYPHVSAQGRGRYDRRSLCRSSWASPHQHRDLSEPGTARITQEIRQPTDLFSSACPSLTSPGQPPGPRAPDRVRSGPLPAGVGMSQWAASREPHAPCSSTCVRNLRHEPLRRWQAIKQYIGGRKGGRWQKGGSVSSGPPIPTQATPSCWGHGLLTTTQGLPIWSLCRLAVRRPKSAVQKLAHTGTAREGAGLEAGAEGRAACSEGVHGPLGHRRRPYLPTRVPFTVEVI